MMIEKEKAPVTFYRLRGTCYGQATMKVPHTTIMLVRLLTFQESIDRTDLCLVVLI